MSLVRVITPSLLMLYAGLAQSITPEQELIIMSNYGHAAIPTPDIQTSKIKFYRNMRFKFKI